MKDARDRAPYAVIVGLGLTGLSAARHLRARGWRIAVTDTRLEPPCRAQLAALDPGVPLRLGGLDTALLDGADCAVASPGVALSEPFFAEACRRGIEIVGDIELFARATEARVAGITGTNGKSTVATLVGSMARRAGARTRLGGNLGEPALDLLAAAQADAEPTDLYVLELSSFQLDCTRSLRLEAGAVLNVTADHLDRYASLEAYAAAKARVLEHCATAVVNLDDPLVAAMPRPGQRVLGFSIAGAAGALYGVRLESRGTGGAAPRGWLTRRGEPVIELAELRIRGLHNAANALAALAVAEALGLPLEPLLAELRSFPGLAHRSQWVADLGGIVYVDDSKGTNVGATLAAVAGLPGPLVMILGGDGKRQDFAPLGTALRGKVRHAVLIGRDREAIASVLAGVAPLERCDSLEAAVRAAARAARPGDTVLLSPACSSLDMFRDYAHRGAVFRRAVEELAA